MTREEVKALLPIMQAFSEGKTIQRRYIEGFDYEKEWVDDNSPNLSIYNFEYRIKPEYEYRPFKDAEECWEEMQKHQPFGWIKYNDNYMNISNIGNSDVISYDGSDYPEIISFKYLELNKHPKITFADGTPFGIKEE